MAISRAKEMVRALVPDMDARLQQFEVETFEMDQELIAAFCEELERMTTDLQSGLDAENNDLIRVAAHSIKGMGGTMGLPEISVLAQEIEVTLRAGRMDLCAPLCVALRGWAQEFIAANS